ncbi:MAG TPA: amidase [Gemmatimonadales bacterium]|nr:amidase [Gemmatimonadales bacterium]
MRRRNFLQSLGAGLGLPLIAPMIEPRFAQRGDIVFASATGAAAAIRTKRISSLELTQLALERIDKFNPQLTAVVNLFREQALARAREADAALAAGTWWGPLHGVPITVKESFGIAGVPATAGAPFLRNHRPAEDSVPVARLRRAGAVLLGNTNVPFMLADWQSYNEFYGTSNNPWDRTRTPGGSSGGSSAALAAGIGHFSIGSDIGGSIRVPAHFCSIYGHKPTVGVVPLRGHIPPLPGERPAAIVPLPVAGPMARSAADLRMGMEVLGGPDEPDSRAFRWALPPSRHRALKDFRVGVVLDDPTCPVLDDVRSVLEQVVATVRRSGARVTEGWPEGINPRAQWTTYAYLLGTYFAGNLPDSLVDATRRAAADPDSTLQGIWNRAWTDRFGKVQAQAGAREQMKAAWESWFRGHDVFLSPVAFTAAFPHDHSPEPFQRTLQTSSGPRPYMDLAWWITPATLSGFPATVAPAGLTRGGLPVGIQIMGPYLEDATSIGFAEALAAEIGGFRKPEGY